MPSVQLTIPDHFHPGLKGLMGLTIDEANRLIASLREEGPVLLAKDLARHVASRSELDPATVFQIVTSLTAMHSVRAELDLPFDAFLEVLYGAIDAQELRPTEPDLWNRFKKNLADLLRQEGAVAVASKALSVVNEHDQIFLKARVITDLRPIFKQDAREAPIAVAIIHNLRITYHRNGKPCAFFLALDDQDLQKLTKVLRRAEQKSKSLRSVVNSAKISILEIQGEEET